MASITIIYVWTRASPNSLIIKKLLEESSYAQLITFLSADSAEVRNMLLYGKSPQVSVPLFIIQEKMENNETTKIFMPIQNVKKIFPYLDKLLEGLEGTQGTHGDTASITIPFSSRMDTGSEED